MSKIWVIEQGSYSDYRVVGVFTSRKNAKLVADAINGANEYSDKAEVAEWPLDPAVADLSAGRSMFNVLMLIDGSVERCIPASISSYETAGSVDIWKRSKAPAYKGKGIPDAMHAMVWASDADHAIKIVNEYRAQWIAEGRWKP